MTKEEIKENTAMRDVLRRYGLPEPNRSGFIACPFHKGDREPSMKIYEKDYHCYACNAALYSRRKKHFIFDGINTVTALSFR